jgi:hypothetical protein
MLDRGERICLHCTLNEVEDESHMLFKCPIYETERATFTRFSLILFNIIPIG